MNYVIRLTLIASLMISCAHHTEFEKHLASGRCEESIQFIDNLKNAGRIRNLPGEVGKKFISYTATAGGYTADFVVSVTGLILIGGIFCAPGIFLSSQTNYNHGSACFIPESISKSLKAGPGFGRTAFENTSDLRCLNMDGLLDAMDKVSKCYERRGGKEDLKKSRDQIFSITTGAYMKRCLPKEKMDYFKERVDSLEQRLTDSV
jgi:hypothetical protein